jgi:hypothetical protein
MSCSIAARERKTKQTEVKLTLETLGIIIRKNGNSVSLKIASKLQALA